MAAFAVMLVLSLASGMASARTRLEVSTTASLLSGSLTFTNELGVRIISDVTLHATMLRLFNKVLLEHVGDVTAAEIANCRTNIFGLRCNVTPLVPMNVAYGAITGTLPTITEVLLFVYSRFLLEIGFNEPMERRCLYEGLVGAGGRNPVRTLTPLRGNSVPLFEDRLTVEACGRRGELSGVMTARPEISVRLLETR